MGGSIRSAHIDWAVRDLAARLLWPSGEMAQEEYERGLAIDQEYQDDDDGSGEQP